MAQNILLEHQVLMQLRPAWERAVQFVALDDSGMVIENHWVPEQVWKDMGGPETITVTVQPGDAVKF